MRDWIAALPMYDWPECRNETDAHWDRLRDGLRAQGVDAPEALSRGDDLRALWRNPNLLLAQTCWGPMEAGLARHVQVVGQPDYSAYEGGAGALYSSAVVMRKDVTGRDVTAPLHGRALLPLDLMRDTRLAYNETLSRSGFLALIQDLKEAGEGIEIFAERLETGGHRASLEAVRDGRADVCAVDCRSWALAQRFVPGLDKLCVVGWTARRLGLPYITSHETDAETLASLRAVLLV
ncbi:phosphate/phosphite/phosphonate ABC transporter substrate-binding protein [Nitratireductor kimnyeongensis]|uniref:Phosphate/phosphite/phosphonate ABC transporter substrate-binding protein n=1 Tax=Nitratireductor kimnyeongensis TaxID=430679 RepID=A0ABW0T5C3_9HYPH|nr:PhnD/SsuA/transferrin family substrate-binding protein [Nitratireductor kimnyeongensis]QZZ35322.1 PhnD/SsuA/transferrin family substrate-binding protein [Nitratireductor kimnyeongensis]